MRKSGSVIDCFYDCQENYDNWTDDNDKRKQRKQQAAKRATWTNASSTSHTYTKSSKVVDFNSHAVNQ